MSGSKQNKCLVICRSKEHVQMALERLGASVEPVEFICLSNNAYIEALKNKIPASPISDYVTPGSLDSANQAWDLTREWTREILNCCGFTQEDLALWVEYNMFSFFHIVLVARASITAVVAAKFPTSVMLCSDWPRVIIGSTGWPLSEGEGEIYARSCEDYLKNHGIECQILRLARPNNKEKETTITGTSSRITAKLKAAAYYLSSLLPAYTLLAKLKWQRSRNHRPLIVMCGAAADAIYLGQLEKAWLKTRPWDIVRFEAIDNSISAFRSGTSGQEAIPRGKNLKLLVTLGISGKTTRLKLNPGSLLAKHYEWVRKSHTELTSVLTNPDLEYQYQAMCDFVPQTINQIDYYTAAFHKISPEVVITYNGLTIAPIAARLAGTSSITPWEGAGLTLFPSWPMLGDVIAVNGPALGKNIELYNRWPGRLVDTGCSFLRAAENPLNSQELPGSVINGIGHTPTVIYLAPALTEYPWSVYDYRGNFSTLKKLAHMATSGLLHLIVKTHPRYGNVKLYSDIMELKDNDVNIEVSASPDFASILKDCALVLGVENSGAVTDTVIARKPLFWLSYLYPRMNHNAFVHDFFSANLARIDSEAVLEETIRTYLADDSLLKQIVSRQERVIGELISAWGDEAAENIAQVCQTLINDKTRGRS